MEGVLNNGRTLVNNPLIDDNGYYRINYDDLEEKVSDPRTKLMILCNPHNPVGRAWSKEELTRIAGICADNNVIILSDEIHADLIMKNASHTALASLSEDIRMNTISQYAPSKTFNLAGLQTAYAIIPNDHIREQFLSGLNANRIFNFNWFGPEALETAYNQCDYYVKELCDYVNDNMDFMKQYLDEKLPMLKIYKPEATYMVWVDFRGTGMTTQEIEHFITHKAHIGVDLGTWFGTGGAGYLRFNVACPRTMLEKALDQLSAALEASGDNESRK